MHRASSRRGFHRRRATGKKERTLYTYRKDLDVVESFFGGGRQLAEIRLPQVGKFYKSDMLLKLPDGKERAERTVAKTVRVFRMMMVWARESGRIEELPLPKSTPMGHSRVKETSDEQPNGACRPKDAPRRP
jgi:hypothetical protein